MNQNIDQPARRVSDVRTHFDEVLVKHIRRLLEIDTLAASLSFNLPTISCLLLLVERENEIKNSGSSSLERYTRETFLDDLSDIGLEIDDDLMTSFKALAQHGYVAIDDDKRYNAQISAFALVSFLDNLFPGMTGLNLVGYILQMIDEVVTSRKELDEALAQLDKTLVSQGIPLSQQKLRQQEKESLKKQAETPRKTVESKRISEDMKHAYIDRLSRLRDDTARSDVKPKIYQSVTVTGNIEVKELFHRKEHPVHPDDATIEEDSQPSDATPAAVEPSRVESENTQDAQNELERKMAEIAEREAALRAAEIAAREAEIAAREEKIKERESEIQEQKRVAPPETTDISEDKLPEESAPVFGKGAMDVEKQIKAFQETLAMDCPICGIGKIKSEATDAGKAYYSCSNENCGFISWGKPYAFQCPVCKNPFLIETSISVDTSGLKCPRATCSYMQTHLGPPEAPVNGADKPKKRRKLVRRVKKK